MAQMPPSGTNPFAGQQPIPGVKHVLAVSSGKGGVGKSSVAVNLAVALSKSLRVGLLDADIYGPSIPRMVGALGQRPQVTPDQRILPVHRHGIATMSIGYLVEDSAAVVWRGPMLFKAMDQFLRDVQWGELDVLVVDLPPGTGDVQLSLAQKVPVTGVVAVTTPQNVALMDVRKSLDMWNRVAVPVLGMIENMAYFQATPDSEPVALFPAGDLEKFLNEQKMNKLGQIPFQPNLGLCCEAGIPLVTAHAQSPASLAFNQIAEALLPMLMASPQSRAPHAPHPGSP